MEQRHQQPMEQQPLPPLAGVGGGMCTAVAGLPDVGDDARPCPPPLPATPARYDYENAYDGGYDNYGDGVDGYGGKGACARGTWGRMRLHTRLWWWCCGGGRCCGGVGPTYTHGVSAGGGGACGGEWGSAWSAVHAGVECPSPSAPGACASSASCGRGVMHA